MSDIEEIFEEAVPEPTKRKKQLSQKQLDGLAKGRAKVAERRAEKKRLEEVNKKFDVKMIEQKVENRKKKREIVKECEETEHRNMLVEKQNNTNKIQKFKTLRTKYLRRCETAEDFDELKGRLDEITEEDILDNDRLKNKLIKMLDNYKK
tara:strand:- start:5553 stop:6002 length:450 start_codon:yes stop_codon:yes gene_type:complete